MAASKDGAVVRALTSHQCGSGAFVLALLRVFFFPALRFSSLPQNQHSKFQFVQDRGFAWNPATACVASSLNILLYKKVSCAIQTWYKCRNLIGQATQTLSAIAVQWLEVVQIMALFYHLFDIYETLLDNLIPKKIKKKKLTVLPLSKLQRFRETISACKKVNEFISNKTVIKIITETKKKDNWSKRKLFFQMKRFNLKNLKDLQG